MNRLLAVACLARLVAACGSGSTLSANDVDSLQIDDVWGFQYPSSGGDDAAHSGVAEIKNDRLFVDDAVVVWHENQIDQASQLIASIKSGDEPQVSLPGGGTSLDEADTPLWLASHTAARPESSGTQIQDSESPGRAQSCRYGWFGQGSVTARCLVFCALFVSKELSRRGPSNEGTGSSVSAVSG